MEIRKKLQSKRRKMIQNQIFEIKKNFLQWPLKNFPQIFNKNKESRPRNWSSCSFLSRLRKMQIFAVLSFLSWLFSLSWKTFKDNEIKVQETSHYQFVGINKKNCKFARQTDYQFVDSNFSIERCNFYNTSRIPSLSFARGKTLNRKMLNFRYVNINIHINGWWKSPE